MFLEEPLEVDSAQLSDDVVEETRRRRTSNRKRCQQKKKRVPRNSLKYVELYFEKQLSEKDELIDRLKKQLHMYGEAIKDMRAHMKKVVRAIHGVQCEFNRHNDDDDDDDDIVVY